MTRRLITALALFATGAAHAAGPCDKAITNVQLQACQAAEYKAADARLNAAYAKLGKLLDDEGRRKLTVAQRAWLAWRDANAEFAGDINRGGTAESLNIVGAKTQMTEARATELEAEIKARQ